MDPKLSNQVRDAVKRWRADDREHCFKAHLRRANRLGCQDAIEALYRIRGDGLEGAFASVMALGAVHCEQVDERGKSGYPDFLIQIGEFPKIVVEIKSRHASTDLVALNAATEVLTASELIGMASHFCLAVCSPCVEPSVSGLIERCARLCVVDVSDLAEAILRVQEERLQADQLYNWLTTPGVALMEQLPAPHQ